MKRLNLLRLLAFMPLFGKQAEAFGQEPRPRCEPESCALSVSIWNDGWRVVRGPLREEAFYPGLWIEDLSHVFAESTDAQALASRYRTTQNLGTLLAAAGVLALVVQPAINGGRFDPWWGAAGLGAAVLGGYQVSRAQAYLDQAILVYNASLSTSRVP